ncbi:unnamed protein product [Paramecium pentaurelia]|uniref:FYVE-type domain-containing protein n=1 Tax=Paramecium pentaurelia TaxID=43138 RepID=A0A8S1TJF1_9CILI|nr:unnamed protein product [Paramecium pentaurelia]
MKGNIFHIDISSQRQQYKSCLICFKDFSVMTKEHQCKRCKRAVCDKCAQNKMIILGYSKSKDPHRVCNICKSESDILKQFVKTNIIQFNKDSLGIEWLKNLGVDIRQIKEQYRIQEQKDLLEYNQFINQLDSIYDEIDRKMNYSIRDFMSLVVQVDKGSVLGSIRNVLGTFLRNYPEVGFHPSLIFTTLILLCLSSEVTSYGLLQVMYTQLIPKALHFRNLRLGYDFKSELGVMIKSFHNLKIPTEPIKPFLQEVGPYIVSMTINAFEIQTSLFMFSQLFQEDGFNEFIKVLACSFSVHQFKDSIEKNKLFILWNVKDQQFQKYYYETKKLRSDSNSSVRSMSQSEQQQQLENKFKQQIILLQQENTSLKQEINVDKIRISKQKIEIDQLNDQIQSFEIELKNLRNQYQKIENENSNLLESNQNLKLQFMKQEKANESSSFTLSTKSDSTHLENELLKCKQEIEVLKLQNTNPTQMAQLVKLKNEQIAKLTQEKSELEKKIEELEEPKISKRTSSVAQISSVIKDLEDGKNLLEKKNQEILNLKKQIQELQQQKKSDQSMTSSQTLVDNPQRNSKVDNEDDISDDLQLLIQDSDPAKKIAARNVKQMIGKLNEELIYYKTQAKLKKEQVEPFRQKSESLQKQLDYLVEQNKELQIEIEHKQDLIQELEKKRVKQTIDPRPQVVQEDRKVLNENKQSCAANSDCKIF